MVKRALPNAKVGLHMHCEWLTQLARNMIGARLGFADAVIGPSEYIAEGIRRRFPEHRHRVRRVYNGADVHCFVSDGRARPADGDVTILYVGRISPEKGIHTLIEAFAIVADRVKNARLRIVGPERVVPYEMMVALSDDPRIAQLGPWFRGGYIEHLHERLRALPRNRVELINREFDHDDLPQFYSSADVFAFPSICDEAFGLPLVEAMASGCVPVATRKGAFPEIVEHERSGLLVEPADAPALAAAIIRLCGDASLRNQMQAAARQRAREHFTWDHVAQSLLEGYDTCDL
jgi:glycosyltransferase involved in cell wall biosynthesis